MRTLAIAFIILFFTASCDRSLKLVENTDEVIVRYKYSPSNSIESYKDPQTIEMFKELLMDNNRKTISTPMGDSLGQIDFINNGQKLLTITLREGGGEFVNNGDTIRTGMTYRVGQILVGL
ncbi:MAG: hypothetical protein WBA61_10220 [Aequorivita sp.]